MFKRGNKTISLFEISLMILSSFAIAFIMQGSLVNGLVIPRTFNAGNFYGESTLPAASGSSNGLAPASVGAGAGAGTGATGNTVNYGLGKADFGILTSSPGSFFAAHLLEGVLWGGVLALGIKFLGPMLGLSEEASNAAALAE